MTKIALKLEIDFDSWMDEDVEPRTKEQWEEFFLTHLISYPTSVLGTEEDGVTRLIALNKWSVSVIE